MGLINSITSEIKERLKEEMLNYLKKIADEKEGEKKGEKETEKKDTSPKSDEKTAQKKEAAKAKEVKAEKKEEEWLPPVNDKDIIRFTLKTKDDDVVFSRSFVSDLQILSAEEFSIYMKLYFFTFTAKKNFGYLGNSLKRKLKIQEKESKLFDTIIVKLEKRGLIETESISATQTTYILYIPFDEDKMKKAEESKHRKSSKPTLKKKKKIDDSPVGKATSDMDEESLMKNYRTFVSLEIDKAKMRVGRSNFDKIYMEAVKYIDKKYGFKVLSDSDKLKEYLTDYYISAFDIPTFDEWKLTHVKKKKG